MIKVKLGENLKYFISYFQSQMALVYSFPQFYYTYTYMKMNEI